MPRIAVVTTLFPIADEPYRGKLIHQTVLALQRLAEVEVYCPVARYPPFLRPRFRYHRPDPSYLPPGVNSVHYFEYSVIPVLTRPVNGEMCAMRLQSYLEKSSADVILNYWLYPEGYAAVKVGRKLGKPVIVGSRGSDLHRIRDRFTRSTVRKTLLGADYVLTVSEELRECTMRFGVAPDRARSIPNGCDPAIFHYRPPFELRNQLRVAQDQRVIVFVGWLDRSKGLLELLEAFRILTGEDSKWFLVCIGEGGLRPALEAFARNHGLTDRIVLTGACSSEEVARWMNAADVFCLPSYAEGCPNVMIEALSCGCPVVVTNVAGIAENFRKEAGILVPRQDPFALAEGLRKAASHNWDRTKLSKLFHRGWDDVAGETMEVCLSVLKKR